jgi:hypothetical protein
MPRIDWKPILVLLVLLLPTSAEAQRVCFSFASEGNVDGPNFFAVPPNLLQDGTPVNPDGRVQVRLLIQPFCDGGPVFSRNLYMLFEAKHYNYQQAPFTGMWDHDWALEGRLVFVDPGTGAQFFAASFNRVLMTSWSPANAIMGKTATLQVSERTDPNMQFFSSPDLDAILVGAGYNPALLHVDEQFAFTITNIRRAGGGGPFFPPLNPANGDWLDKWEADGSFSAAAGQ